MGCHIAAQGTVDVIVMILYFKKSFLWAKIALHNEIKKKIHILSIQMSTSESIFSPLSNHKTSKMSW